MWLIYAGLLIWYAIVVSVGLLGVFRVMSMRRQQSSDSYLVESHEPVTILRPLKGLDPELYENLRSVFSTTMPFEMIFCIDDASDPAKAVAERLCAEFPQADAKILVGAENYGPNPKINNLSKGYMQAKHDLLWVLDSNVRIDPNTLVQAVQIFNTNPTIKLVHNIPAAVATMGGWGSQLEEMYLLTSHSKFYTGINTVGIAPCVCGKSNFYRRSDLDRATGAQQGEGIRTFAQYISEDHLIAEALWEMGGRTQLVNQPVVQPLGNSKLEVYTSRRIRWLRVRKYMVMAATLVEPTTECLVSGLIGGVAIAGVLQRDFSWSLLGLHCLLWCLVDYLNFNMLTVRPRVKLHQWLPIWLARELLCLPIWLVAMLGSHIEWRNKPFVIRPDLVAEEIIN